MTARELEANVEIGDFRVEERVGAGGMGIVYRARQVSLDRVVALKVLGTALTDPGAVARFRRAAQATAKLNHPGIAQVYFIGQDRDVCFMAMEFVAGTSLERIVRRLAESADPDATIDSVGRDAPDGPPGPAVRFDRSPETVDEGPQPDPTAGGPAPTPQADRLIRSADHVRRCCAVAHDAARALDHAHRQGVIHRDVKPGNLMLDRAGAVHVIDFGIARFFEDATLTHSGQLVGTPMYMSPEQVSGRLELDHRTDVYSLGLVLYELLTLRPPVAAPNREALLRHVLTKPLPPVGRLNDAIPPALQSVVHQAAARDADDRYQTAADFADDLQRFLDGKPVAAKPYRYRVNEQEIAATRPSSVSVAAVTWIAYSLLGVNDLVRSLGAWRPGATPFTPWGFALALAGVIAVMVGVAWGLLTGRGWARWLAVAFAAVGLCSVPLAIVTSYQFGSDLWQFPEFIRQRVVGWAFSAGTAYALLNRSSREWFRYVGRLRREAKRPAAGAASPP
ncbi:MAG TPA: serine/threonine-protein kinase [Gemmataceae bacterium]|jgi:serine/threonine protein kinase